MVDRPFWPLSVSFKRRRNHKIPINAVVLFLTFSVIINGCQPAKATTPFIHGERPNPACGVLNRGKITEKVWQRAPYHPQPPLLLQLCLCWYRAKKNKKTEGAYNREQEEQMMWSQGHHVMRHPQACLASRRDVGFGPSRVPVQDFFGSPPRPNKWCGFAGSITRRER